MVAPEQPRSAAESGKRGSTIMSPGQPLSPLEKVPDHALAFLIELATLLDGTKVGTAQNATLLADLKKEADRRKLVRSARQHHPL